MTWLGYLAMTSAAVLGIAITGVMPMPLKLIWNATASAPVGFYTIAPAERIEVPDLVAVMPPEPFASFMVERGYVGRDVPLRRSAPRRRREDPAGRGLEEREELAPDELDFARRRFARGDDAGAAPLRHNYCAQGLQ
ncbi:MAG: S26 family signal peptidase, partial [Brevundimonas sp.]|nr:S26 family signal peptidase [Brevundimonas sp.]